MDMQPNDALIDELIKRRLDEILPQKLEEALARRREETPGSMTIMMGRCLVRSSERTCEQRRKPSACSRLRLTIMRSNLPSGSRNKAVDGSDSRSM